MNSNNDTMYGTSSMALVTTIANQNSQHFGRSRLNGVVVKHLHSVLLTEELENIYPPALVQMDTWGM